MKKIVSVALIFVFVIVLFAGCQREADRVSYNLSKEADQLMPLQRPM